MFLVIKWGKEDEMEHSEFKFVSLEESLKLLKYETNKDSLKKVHEIIKKA